MSLRSRVLGFVDVVLRVPPLFIIDELFRIGLGLPLGDSYFANELLNSEDFSSSEKTQSSNSAANYDSQFYKVFLITLLKFSLSCLGCLGASCIFMLWTKHLVIVYLYLISVGIVFISYWANVATMKNVIAAMASSNSCVLEDLLSLSTDRLVDLNGCAFVLIQNYIIQCILAYLFNYVHLGPRYTVIQKGLLMSFMAPSVLGLLPLPEAILHHAPVFAALLPLALVKFVLWTSAVSVCVTLYSGYQHARAFISNFGISALVEGEWARLNVPSVLRTFWLLRVLEHVGTLALSSSPNALPTILLATKSLLTTGCETLTAVLGMTSIVSYICHYIGCFFQWVLLTEEEDDRSIGTVSAILFYILALQTGLTGLEPEKRFVRLCRNFCLLFTALLHFVHNIVNPLLMSLSASHNPSVHRRWIPGEQKLYSIEADKDNVFDQTCGLAHYATLPIITLFISGTYLLTLLRRIKSGLAVDRFSSTIRVPERTTFSHFKNVALRCEQALPITIHVRALLVCLFLIVYPVSLLVYLWSHHRMSTWLLAVSAFSIEVIVKVIVSLLIYSLFLVDAYRSTFWEKLDDYVYYIRAFGNTVEFCFGIFLFFNGAFILVFESGGAIRAGMMCVHAYFNIWCEARAGWSVFIKRRTAVNKIESLPEASPPQLARLDDVCAICYQEMRTAKITSCNHFFHGVCLRKWLYVQDRCPLCHEILYKVDMEGKDEAGEESEEEEVDGEEEQAREVRLVNNVARSPNQPMEIEEGR